MRIVLIMIAIALTGCFFPEALPPDQTDWEYDRPSNHNMNEDFLFVIDDSIEARTYGDINSLLVLKNEKIVYEKYYTDLNGPFQRRSKFNLGRSTLLITGIALGIAIEEGLILDLQTPIHTYLPEYSDLFETEGEKFNITLENLLVHTSGLSWNEAITSYQSQESDINLMRSESDWAAYVLEKPLSSDPGLRYEYHSGSGMLLSRIISNVSGESMEEFISTRFFRRLGITQWDWESDPTGTTNGATGLQLSLFDLTKIASVYLDEGRWQGRFVIDPDWAIEATLVQNIFGNNFDFGYQWWRFSDNFELNNTLPLNDVFFFPNETGDHVYVIPHQNMIVSIGAENPFYSFYNPSLFLYFDITRAVN